MGILSGSMQAPLSLYLHIPFCAHRCAYCDFNTYAGLEDKIPAYVQAVCHEIQIVGLAAQEYVGEPAQVHTVFFGGGTPSLLTIDQLDLILSSVHENFSVEPGSEITLEANPGTVNAHYLRGLYEAGINRLSLGMQSAHPDELRMLERQHTLEDIIQAVSWARRAGFENINLDLIFGLPQQTLESWKRTCAMALSLSPDHLALYALTLEDGTPMHAWVRRGLVPEPDSDLAADMYEYAMQCLEEAGYVHYEISNWARCDSSGSLLSCRHNLQYWRTMPYLGIGAGAHGFVAGQRTANVLSPIAYIQRLHKYSDNFLEFPQTPATSERIPIDRQTEIGEVMMMGLRLVQEGVSDLAFKERFGDSLEQVFAPQIKNLIHAGLLEWFSIESSNRTLRLTSTGRLLGNRVFREFI